MQSIIRKIILASAFGVAATLGANTAFAATTVKVPFSFTVAGKTLPAGNYHVNRDSTGSFVTLESLESSQSFTWVLSPGQPDPYDEKVALRFHDRGDTHVLQSIQCGSMITPRLDKIKKGSSERDLQGQ
jgi:hypothetical protein